jgi:peptidoglycan-associated lipoprotein
MLVITLAACKKKPPPAPVTAPPPPPAPTATLSANPTSVEKGQAVTLTWRTENATDVSIDGIGKVDLSGSQSVTPADSTTYHLVAKGPGGQQEATARVTVTQPPPQPTPVQNQNQESEEQAVTRQLQDVYFDYDSYNIRPDAQSALQADAALLKQHPNVKITIEGHCDERGSTEYNLALGDNRARSTRDALVQLGVPASQLSTISYGKEKPFCTESNEQCWQQNRRGHFVVGTAGSR